MTGHRPQTALAAVCRRARAGPRSPSGWKKREVFSPRHAPWSCQSQTSATGFGSLRMSAISPPRLGASRRGLSGCCKAPVPSPSHPQTRRDRNFSARVAKSRSSPPGVRAGVVARSCRSSSEQVVAEPGGGETRVRCTAGRVFPGRSEPGGSCTGESEEQAVIDDRMRGPGQGATNVWVYDERRRVRDDVASRLVALPFVGRVEVVGDAASLMSRLATRSPDVLIVGTQRAVDTGLTAATQALRAHPGLPVLVLGAPDDAESVRAPVAFGARGYLRWDASPIEMGLGLSRVGLRADGGRIPQQTAAVAVNGVPVWSGAAPLAGGAPTTVRSTVREATPAASLSMREMQVLTGMSQGKSNAQIGRELYLSEDTIKTHARRLFRKLGAKDRAEAVATGFRRGIMT